MPAATADLSECCQVVQNQFLCLTPSTRCSLFSSPNLSRLNHSHSIYSSFLETAQLLLYILFGPQTLTFIATKCSDDFTGLTWNLDSSHVKAAFLPAKTHVDNLNLKSSKTSCASCFSPRKTQIKQICINYHIYSQQTLALSTAKWVVWEMQGEHFH